MLRARAVLASPSVSLSRRTLCTTTLAPPLLPARPAPGLGVFKDGVPPNATLFLPSNAAAQALTEDLELPVRGAAAAGCVCVCGLLGCLPAWGML